MTDCYISHQIAQHCDQDESFCPECGGNMYFDEFDSSTLVCDSCGEEINTERDE